MHDQGRPWRGRGGSDLPLDAVEGRYTCAAQAALLGGLRLEPLLVGLSDAYEMCRWGQAGGVAAGV
jgi:hypothetical protein